MKKRTHIDHGPSHVTPAGRSVFYDLGFDEAEARVLEMRACRNRPSSLSLRSHGIPLIIGSQFRFEEGDRIALLAPTQEAFTQS
jgi:hypothetical protein